ncbi:protein ZINC INDUCED FACILITATOR-LIKE 1-like protein [Corchorus olitorius]|uniref:Protein ZINC INDUCED FACILITATOR-LIKE 1-like protein n=1 Tax=Corchorus olitorius TaxID=93759 RepID=A0A1R3J6L5_9ROSI|nr:protein ZINC INDUCED FACILITATOR-LIKE 1-like protein [Corchorus olitorius]
MQCEFRGQQVAAQNNKQSKHRTQAFQADSKARSICTHKIFGFLISFLLFVFRESEILILCGDDDQVLKFPGLIFLAYLAFPVEIFRDERQALGLSTDLPPTSLPTGLNRDTIQVRIPFGDLSDKKHAVIRLLSEDDLKVTFWDHQMKKLVVEELVSQQPKPVL